MARQFGNPHGSLGLRIGVLMGMAHSPDYAAVLSELLLWRGIRLLEVGMGVGLHVPLLVARGVDYCGIDRSPDMVAAAHLNEPAGRFICADVCDADLPACEVAIAVNTVQWWRSLGTGLLALRDALVDGGPLVIGVSEPPPEGLLPEVGQRHYTPGELCGVMQRVGFRRVFVATKEVAGRPYIIARGVA